MLQYFCVDVILVWASLACCLALALARLLSTCCRPGQARTGREKKRQ